MRFDLDLYTFQFSIINEFSLSLGITFFPVRLTLISLQVSKFEPPASHTIVSVVGRELIAMLFVNGNG